MNSSNGPKIECTGNCDWLFENVFINARGDVSTCCQQASFSMGNLLKEGSFGSIWNGENFRRLRQAFWDGYVPRQCYGCQFVVQNSLARLEVVTPIDLKGFKNINYK